LRVRKENEIMSVFCRRQQLKQKDLESIGRLVRMRAVVANRVMDGALRRGHSTSHFGELATLPIFTRNDASLLP